jgi:HSP20 family protein
MEEIIMAIIRWNPMRDLMSVEREFNKIFNSLDRKFTLGDSENEEFENAVWMPMTDILEDDNQYYLNIDLPGIKKEDVKINYSNGQLSISGERKQETVKRMQSIIESKDRMGNTIDLLHFHKRSKKMRSMQNLKMDN